MDLIEENKKQMKTMRENFKFLRMKRNWSFKKLSEISGINEKILTNIEEGDDFEVQYIITLCNIYNIKPHEIFSRIV